MTRGTPTYTQDSRAFHPSAWRIGDSSLMDRIGISLDAKGGGTYGEFSVSFHNFQSLGRDVHFVKLNVFADGWVALMDKRVFPAIEKIMKTANRKKGEYATRGITPEEAINILREYKMKPSEYHTKGWAFR